MIKPLAPSMATGKAGPIIYAVAFLPGQKRLAELAEIGFTGQIQEPAGHLPWTLCWDSAIHKAQPKADWSQSLSSSFE